MKRSTWFAAVGAVGLFIGGCTNDGTGGNRGAAGTGGAATGTGGASATGGSGEAGGGSAGASSAGGAAGGGGGQAGAGSGGLGGGMGGAGPADAATSGGAGGRATGGTRRDAAAAGGESGGGGSSIGGGAGTSTARGGATGGGAGGGVSTGGRTGTGGTTGTGGGTATGGATAVDGGPAGAVPSAGCGKAATLESGRTSIEVGAKSREYILALPTGYDPSHPYTLVFAWHPWGGSAQDVSRGRYFGLQSEAGNQAIFVAGEGQDYQSRGLGWGNAGGEDFDFLQAMLERFRSQLCVDESRIFSTGFSFGAMFSFSLGCEADSMMRAIIPMAGNTTTSGGCAAGTRPVAVLALIGVDDTLLAGHRQAVQTYAKRNGCTTTTQPAEPSWCEGLAASNLPCTCVSYQGCQEGYPVVECEYKAAHQAAPNPGPIWDFIAQF